MKKISFAVLSVLFGSSLYAVDYSSMTYEQLEALKGTIPVEQREIFQEAMRNKKQNQNQINKEYRDDKKELKLQQKEERKDMKQLQKEEQRQLREEMKEQKQQFLQEHKKQNEGGQRKGMM